MNKDTHFFRLWLPLAAACCLLLAWRATLAGARQPAPLPIPADVQQAVGTAGEARVLLLLDTEQDNHAPERARIRQAQNKVLATLRPDKFTLARRYQALPALSGRITAEGLRALATGGQVAAVQLDRPGGGHLGQSVPALHADTLHADYALTGAGVTVAVLDSGVDSDHPDLVDDLVAQQCFTDGNCPPYDGDTGASAEDEHGHGSNVASIITARGAVAGPGFAPDAGIVAVRVLDEFNSGWVSDWVAGLDWVLANRERFQIDLVNLSLGTWALYQGNCDAQEPLLAYAVSRLQAAGIAVIASSGNQGMANAMAAPACNSGVIAVGATYDANLGREPDQGSYYEWFRNHWPECHDDDSSLETIACFSNGGEMLDLLAPGARITGAGLDGERWFYYGTSQAAPTVSGIAALMLQAADYLAPDTLEMLLEAGGAPLTDPRSGRQTPAVDALDALRPLLPVAPAGLSLAGPRWAATGVPAPFTATVAPPSSTQPLLYHWQATTLPDQIAGGSLTQTAIFSWTRPGTYTVTVTATNEAGAVTATHRLTVAEVSPRAVALTGPEQAATGAPYRLQAAVQPPTASWPITYHWQADAQLPQIHSGGTLDRATFTWDLPGRYTVTLTATNALSTVTHTRAVDVAIVAPASLHVTGPDQGATGFPVTLTVAPSPTLLSRPITYTWWASDQPTRTIAGEGLEAATSYTWDTAGVKEIGVRLQNEGGSVQDVHRITIREVRHAWLPLLSGP